MLELMWLDYLCNCKSYGSVIALPEAVSALTAYPKAVLAEVARAEAAQNQNPLHGGHEAFANTNQSLEWVRKTSLLCVTMKVIFIGT